MTLADPVSLDLKRHLRTLKLGQLLATLPDRLTLARQQQLPHADFLELWRPATSVDSDHTRITGHRRNPDGDEVPEVRRRL